MKRIIFALMLLAAAVVCTDAQTSWNKTMVNNKIIRYSHRFWSVKSGKTNGMTLSLYIRYSGKKTLDEEIDNPTGNLEIFLHLGGGQFYLVDAINDSQAFLVSSEVKGNNTYIMPLVYPSDGSTDFAFVNNDYNSDVIYTIVKELTMHKAFKIRVPMRNNKYRTFTFKVKEALNLNK